MRTIGIKVFPGATNLPLWIADECGFLARRGLALDLRYTGGSVEQLTELVAGTHDLILTLMDNVVAYRSRQGEVPTEGDSDIVAVFGCDDGFPRFAVQPGVRGFEDLPGRTISVDAMTTGLAFLLRRLLAQRGIAESAVNIVPVGGVLQRWEAMMRGEHDATFLVTPFDLMSAPAGIRVLARGQDVCDPYQGNVIATRRAFARDNEAALTGFLSAYLESLAWLSVAANRAAAVEILGKHLPALDRATAERTCAVFLDGPHGLSRDGLIAIDGVASLLDLRRAYGPAGGELQAAQSYFDLRYVRAAGA